MAKRGRAAHKKLYSTHQKHKPDGSGSIHIRKRMRQNREAAAALEHAEKVVRSYNAGDKKAIE